MSTNTLPTASPRETQPDNITRFPAPESAPVPDTRAELEALVARAVRSRLEADALRGDVEREITALRAHHQPQLEHAERAAENARAAVQAWADAHRRDAFGNRKSLACLHATVGYRSKPPRVERIRPRTKWETVTAALRKQSWAAPYLRLPEPEPELNKEALLADRRKLPPGALAHAGLRVVEGEEQFYVKPHETHASAASPASDEAAADELNVIPLAATG